MTESTELFAFERDKCAGLMRMPMHFRYKLDACGIKLAIVDWKRLSYQDKLHLLHLPYANEQQIRDFRSHIKTLVSSLGSNVHELPALPNATPWNLTGSLPDQVCDALVSIGVNPPTHVQWCTLTQLQRYTLYKLTRKAHLKTCLLTVLLEFGLIETN